MGTKNMEVDAATGEVTVTEITTWTDDKGVQQTGATSWSMNPAQAKKHMSMFSPDLKAADKKRLADIAAAVGTK